MASDPPPEHVWDLSLPAHALCAQCHYTLHGLRDPRCPECGRAFDPNEIETLYIATWRGFLARRFLKRAGIIFYVWPLLAAALTYVAWDWGNGVREPWTGIRAPRWPGRHYAHLEMLSLVVIALWLALLVTWLVRIPLRRFVVVAFDLPYDRLTRDRRARKFAAWCFVLAMLLIGPHTDRCTHGEYWEMWSTIGIERDAAGGFCERHAKWCVPLGAGWRLYWRR